ncbi:MAG: hypothetical protein KI793_27660 [Rivularia sp. (in: Bacteria)]|nr:hypothetical protein [Rivularia sp. MS3]
MKIKTATLGYPRIGKNREVKKALEAFGFPKDKPLGIGIIYAKNIWQIRPEEVISKLETIKDIFREFEVQPSASLQFVPYDATQETQLPEALRNVLSFAEKKLQEIVFLAKKVTVCDAKCNHEPLVNFNRNHGQNQSKFDATKLTVTRCKKDQKPGRLLNSD